MEPVINPPEQSSSGLGTYLRQNLRADAAAGLTVAVMGVPQAMAYALIAGLPPVYGLYTAIVTCAVAAILGSSNHLVTGPTNALCMVMLSLTAHLPEKYGVDLMEIILLLAFMSGLIQMAFGALRLGRVVRYVSNSVVVGFTAGAGILIALNQLKNILGIDISVAHAERSYEVLSATLQRILETNPYALGVGLGTIFILLVTPKIHPRLPTALIAVAVTGVISYLLGLHNADVGAWRVEIVRDIQPIEGSLKIFHLPELLLHPNYELTRELGTGALAVAILGLIEATSISRAVATSSGQQLNFTREFVAQGTSKVVGSFFTCFAGSGSFTRTAMCFKSGGRTRMAATFSAIWTAMALIFLGEVANFIPKAALAGILIVVAYSMIDKRRLNFTWRSSKNSRMVLVGTIAATLILPLEYAIFVGVFLSVAILLRTTGKTDLTQLVAHSDSGFEEVPFNRAAASPVVTINMEGALYWAAAEDLDRELLRSLTPETRVVVLRMKRLRAVGSTAMAMLEHFWTILREKNIYLVVCGIEDELEAVLTRSGVRKQIGEANIFYADNKLFQSTQLALARAWSIVDMERQQADTVLGGPLPVQPLTANDIMNSRCIRFGNQHQLREAVWLMSEMQKHTKSIGPESLFLQDKEAKLFGELSPWRVLQCMSEGTDLDNSMDDQKVGEELRRNFLLPIFDMARTDMDGLATDASLTRMLEESLKPGMQVLPICDADGRIKGLVNADDLLKGLMLEMDRSKSAASTEASDA